MNPGYGAAKTERSLSYLLGAWFPAFTVVGLVVAQNHGFWATLLFASAALAPLIIGLQHYLATRGLSFQSSHAEPFHEGQPGVLHVGVENAGQAEVRDVDLLRLSRNDTVMQAGEGQVLAARQTSMLHLPLEAGSVRRGRHPVGKLALRSGYPFNLFITRVFSIRAETILVWPAAEAHAPSWPQDSLSQKRKTRRGEDVIGLREHQPMDCARTIDWKQSAKAGEIVVREFEEPMQQDLVFSWNHVQMLEQEHALQRLTAWVLRADREGRSYGLDLQGQTIAAGRGKRHKEQCLTALALFGRERT